MVRYLNNLISKKKKNSTVSGQSCFGYKTEKITGYHKSHLVNSQKQKEDIEREKEICELPACQEATTNKERAIQCEKPHRIRL